MLTLQSKIVLIGAVLIATAAHAQNVDFDSMRTQVPTSGSGDISVTVTTTTVNDGAEPNNATTTTDTKVVRPPHIVAQGPAPIPQVDASDYPPQTDADSKLVYVSGGVGAAEIAYFKQLKNDYTLKLLAADKEGHLVDEVVVTLNDAEGKKLATFSDVGPYLLVKLPAGRYMVDAMLDNVHVTRNVTIKAGKQTAVDVRF